MSVTERRVVEPAEPMVYGLAMLGNPVLREKSRPIEYLDDVPPTLIPSMHEIMERHQAIGIAAQQAGSTWRVALMRKDNGDIRVYYNLCIVERSAQMVISKEEGCLSVQHNGEYFRLNVPRHKWVEIEYRNEAWEFVRERVQGVPAMIAQHECDHLDGKCIVDGLRRESRRRALQLARRHKEAPLELD